MTDTPDTSPAALLIEDYANRKLSLKWRAFANEVAEFYPEELSWVVAALAAEKEANERAASADDEFDAKDRASMFLDWCALHKFGLAGWPAGACDQLVAHMRAAYTIGQSARAKRIANLEAEVKRLEQVIELNNATFRDCL